LRACALVLHTSTNFAEAVTQGKRLNDFISMGCDLRVSPSMYMIAPMLAERKKKLDDNRPVLAGHHTANTFNLLPTVLAQKVKAHAIALRLLEVIIEAMA
jgi:hypothetical protein